MILKVFNNNNNIKKIIINPNLDFHVRRFVKPRFIGLTYLSKVTELFGNQEGAFRNRLEMYSSIGKYFNKNNVFTKKYDKLIPFHLFIKDYQNMMLYKIPLKDSESFFYAFFKGNFVDIILTVFYSFYNFYLKILILFFMLRDYYAYGYFHLLTFEYVRDFILFFLEDEDNHNNIHIVYWLTGFWTYCIKLILINCFIHCVLLLQFLQFLFVLVFKFKLMCFFKFLNLL